MLFTPTIRITYMKHDLLLLTAPVPDGIPDCFPHLGPAFLKSHLENLGFSIRTINMTTMIRSHYPWFNPHRKAVSQLMAIEPLKKYLRGENVENVDKAAGILWNLLGENISAKVFGFSVLTQYSLPIALAMASWLKRRQCKQRVIFGGSVFLEPQFLCLHRLPWIDHLVVGPGIHILPILLVKADAPRLITMPDEPLPLNLIPRFDLLDLMTSRNSSARRKLILPYQLTKGCHFQCQYCTNVGIHPESMPVGKAISDLHYLQRTYRPDNIYLTDVNLNNDTRYLDDFCNRLIKNNLSLHFGGSLSVKGLDQHSIGLLATAGCRYAYIGIETGSPRIRKLFRITKIPSSPKLEMILRQLYAAGINNHLYFMHSFPGESDRDFALTLTLARRLSWYAANGTVYPFALKYGAPAFHRTVELGIIPRHLEQSADALSCLDPCDPKNPMMIMSHPYDEIDGLSWEEKLHESAFRQKRLAEIFHYISYPRRVINMLPIDPLYQLKKVIKPYFF